MTKNLLVRVSLIECKHYEAPKPLWFDNFTLDDIRKVSKLESTDSDVSEFLIALCELVEFSETVISETVIFENL